MSNYEEHRKLKSYADKHYDYKSQWREPKRDTADKKETNKKD